MSFSRTCISAAALGLHNWQRLRADGGYVGRVKSFSRVSTCSAASPATATRCQVTSQLRLESTGEEGVLFCRAVYDWNDYHYRFSGPGYIEKHNSPSLLPTDAHDAGPAHCWVGVIKTSSRHRLRCRGRLRSRHRSKRVNLNNIRFTCVAPTKKGKL